METTAVSASSRPIKRRARMALSCQRCRKHRSKCSRSRPSCEQCNIAGVTCVYLEVPGDLESTALRDRFAGLENQIHSVIDEFSRLESIFRTVTQPNDIQTRSLQRWTIYHSEAGLSIDTHMFHVTDIYSTLIRFAQDNTVLYTPPEKKPVWLIRNHSLFPHVRLSHFTSLRPNVHDGEDDEDDQSTTSSQLLEDVGEDDMNLPTPLPPTLVHRLISLYKTCLLYGAVQPFDTLFSHILTNTDYTCLPPAFQLLYASIICHMLPHAFYWHPEIFENTMDEANCTRLSVQYYKWAKRLLSGMYFDLPCLMTCHAICNLVLYHIENGNTSVVYLYSGMAVRMALSLQLYREDSLEIIAENQAAMFPTEEPDIQVVKEYARSLLWFMYFLDTASSHYHNKPYEIHLDDHVSTTTYFKKNFMDHQAFFQWIEFHTCQITRDIRRTIFTHTEEVQTSYEAIERIEKRLLDFQKELPPLSALTASDSIWYQRCIYKQWIRHHGHWILIHQSYLPTPMSLQRCTAAAFALVELFDAWIVQVDCYFRPCVHELKQACEILLYHVSQNTPVKARALEGLIRLVKVLLRTPVGEIAKTRPFVQRVMRAVQSNNLSVFTC
ncbi:hypothetical protein G6F70_004958 [Rhizopus microsporus]|uniref:Zn(2)-C6 fungal-type domain-containing protein n=2 Tax=Rhizopus TaxID=4842 RepID=A0A367K6M5_RHIAZ|nr:hypothetical protein G6F71_001218 [Rhizopus microsporus]RCH97874.1 hypothetical protein CU097_008356 [Rhizopus azygosporus]KAG1199411.1 hypothetical protein G6F70_004958 [Rhizopus microsporus]KAG1207504.1 hypothetical protein G6F69_007996 [Rhizopus microsporus]KAG1233088.1 hypothetical protein G6F67_004532 [Rhizopus microsporus]